MDISVNNLAHQQATVTKEARLGLKARIDHYIDGQAHNRTYWFIFSLIAQGVFFLPIPAVLVYYFHAPIPVVIITLSLFFANVIAGMGGGSIRTIIYLFAASAIIHALLLIGFMIF